MCLMINNCHSVVKYLIFLTIKFELYILSYFGFSRSNYMLFKTVWRCLEK